MTDCDSCVQSLPGARGECPRRAGLPSVVWAHDCEHHATAEQVDTLEEFAEAGAAFRQERFEASEELRIERLEGSKALHREREADRRDRDAILRRLRIAEGDDERCCACGCGRVFPVRLGPGRPQRFATVRCRIKAAVAAWRERQ